jgi:hypothetical protein
VNGHDLPLSADLFESPQLAVLAVVDTAVEVCLVALLVAHPDDDRDVDALPLERRAARSLVTALYDVSLALRRYRLALQRAKERDRKIDLPF